MSLKIQLFSKLGVLWVERLQLIIDGTMYLLVPELVVLLYKFAPSSALLPCAEVKIFLL